MKPIENIQRTVITALTFLCIALPVMAQENTGNSIAVDPMEISADMTTFNCTPFIPEGCTITVLQGDHTKGNFDVLFKVPANFEIPKHWHTSPERMVLLSGTMEVTYDGEETQVLNKGDYAYGPAKKPHFAKCGDNGPCTLFIAFEDALDAFPLED